MSRIVLSMAALFVFGCGGLAPPEGTELPLQSGMDPDLVVPGERIAVYRDQFAAPAGVFADMSKSVLTPHQLKLCGGEATVGDPLDVDDFTLGFWMMPYEVDGYLLSAGPLQLVLFSGHLVTRFGDAMSVSPEPIVRFTEPVIVAAPHHIQLTHCDGMLTLHIDGKLAGTLYGTPASLQADVVQLGSALGGLCGTVDDLELRDEVAHHETFTPPRQLVLSDAHVFAFDFDGAAGDLVGDRSLSLRGAAQLAAPLPYVR